MSEYISSITSNYGDVDNVKKRHQYISDEQLMGRYIFAVRKGFIK